MRFNSRKLIAVFCVFLVFTLTFAVPSLPASAATEDLMEKNCEGKGLWGIFGGDPKVRFDGTGKGKTVNKDDLGLAEWCDYSYRKNDVGFVTADGQSRYHPDRYMEGKDWTACFGQNNWLVDGFKNPKDDPNDGDFQLKLNPRNSWLLSFQCLCLTGIRDRLDLLRGILSAIMACLISVRTSTFADSTLCKELFTTYVCDLIWEIIQWITRGCIGWGENPVGAESNGLVEVFSTTIGAASDAVTSIGDDVASDYGNALASGIFGASGDNLARAICLWFFGFDFPLTFDTILDATYGQPGQTLVTCDLVKSREYLYSIPGTKKNTMEYNVGCLIRAGCPIADARIELACASMTDEQTHEGVDCSGPDPMGVGDGNKCDCYSVASNIVIPRAVYGTLGRIDNRQVNQPSPGPKLINMPYRYDHAVLKLRLDKSGRQAGGASGTLGVAKAYSAEDCFPRGHEDGEWWFPLKDKTKVPLGGCSISPTTGEFFCSTLSDLGLNGSAYIDKVRINQHYLGAGTPGPRIYDGDSLTFAPSIFKDTEDDLCLLVELYDHNGQPVPMDVGASRSSQVAISVKGQGSHEYPVTLVRSVGSGRTTSNPVPNFMNGVVVSFGSPAAIFPPKHAQASDKELAISFIDADQATPDGIIHFTHSSIKPADKIRIAGGGEKIIKGGCDNLLTDHCQLLNNDQGLRIKHPTSDLQFTVRSVSLTPLTGNTAQKVKQVDGKFSSPDTTTNTGHVDNWKIRYKLLRLLPGQIDCRSGFDDSPNGVVYSTSGQPQMFETPIFIAPAPAAGVGGSGDALLPQCDSTGTELIQQKCLCGNKQSCDANTYCVPQLNTLCSLLPKCPNFNPGSLTFLSTLGPNQRCLCGVNECLSYKFCYSKDALPASCGDNVPVCQSGDKIVDETTLATKCDCNLDGDLDNEDFGYALGATILVTDNNKIKKLVCCGAKVVKEDSCPGQPRPCSAEGGECILPTDQSRYGCTLTIDQVANTNCVTTNEPICCKKKCAGACGEKEICDAATSKCKCGDLNNGALAPNTAACTLPLKCDIATSTCIT
jgi:hypothetical protein